MTINLTLKDGGIFRKAQIAAENYTTAQNQELDDLERLNNTLNDRLNGLGLSDPVPDLTVGFKESEKVNKPRLTSSLKPVTVDGGNITPVGEDTDNWYDYYNAKWANAKSNDGSLWVWIPRFAYKLDSTSETIDIVFLKGTSDEPADTLSDGTTPTSDIEIKRLNSQNVGSSTDANTYIVHPAFCNGSSTNYANGEWSSDIAGFWMAKFEAAYPEKSSGQTAGLQYSKVNDTSPNNKNYYYGDDALSIGKDIIFPVFQPNRPSYNNICVDDIFSLCQNMNNDGSNPYGFTSGVDTHMTKNSEWGAVAYLSWDKHTGIGHEMNINNITANGSDNIYAITGYGASSSDASAQTVTPTTYITDSGEATAANGWTTTEGKNASTTGNTTGVYDMSGGVCEVMASYVKSSSGLSTYGSTNFNGNTDGKASDQYRTKYETDYSNLTVKGDAVKETSTEGTGTSGSWPKKGSVTTGSYSDFPGGPYPFFYRRRRLVYRGRCRSVCIHSLYRRTDLR